MTRPLRIEYAGAVYHVTSRGNERKAVFKGDEVRIRLLNTLQHVNKRYKWICHACRPMTSHLHQDPELRRVKINPQDLILGAPAFRHCRFPDPLVDLNC